MVRNYSRSSFHRTNNSVRSPSQYSSLLSPPPPIKRSSPSRPRKRPLPPVRVPTPILLGHSLESDLKALKICHSLPLLQTSKTSLELFFSSLSATQPATFDRPGGYSWPHPIFQTASPHLSQIINISVVVR